MDGEKRLLNIISNPDSNLHLPAFKRLVRIYKTKNEDEQIYSFLENFLYNADESTKYLVECISDFIDHENHLIKFSRSMKIYDKVIEKIIHLVKNENIQISLFVLLSDILQMKPCKKHWIENIAEVFYTTKKLSVERMAGKILISVIALNNEIDYASFKKIDSKIRSYANSNTLQSSELYNLLNSTLYNRHPTTVDDYICFLKNKDIVSLIRYSNDKFIERNIKDIDKRADIISMLYLEGINSEVRILFLEHLLSIFKFSNTIQNEFKKSNFIDVLCNISEEDESAGYICIKILNILFENKENQVG